MVSVAMDPAGAVRPELPLWLMVPVSSSDGRVLSCIKRR